MISDDREREGRKRERERESWNLRESERVGGEGGKEGEKQVVDRMKTTSATNERSSASASAVTTFFSDEIKKIRSVSKVRSGW